MPRQLLFSFLWFQMSLCFLKILYRAVQCVLFLGLASVIKHGYCKDHYLSLYVSVAYPFLFLNRVPLHEYNSMCSAIRMLGTF